MNHFEVTFYSSRDSKYYVIPVYAEDKDDAKYKALQSKRELGTATGIKVKEIFKNSYTYKIGDTIKFKSKDGSEYQGRITRITPQGYFVDDPPGAFVSFKAIIKNKISFENGIKRAQEEIKNKYGRFFNIEKWKEQELLEIIEKMKEKIKNDPKLIWKQELKAAENQLRLLRK